MKFYSYLLLVISFSLFAQPKWQALTSLPANTNKTRFDDVFFINENLGWAANGANAAVYKTIDGGVTWKLQFAEKTTALPGNFYFRNIEFLNENIGFLGTLNDKFYKTIDGGENWIEVTNITPNPKAICGLDAVGESIIFGCGAYFTPAYIIKSIDAGVTWQYIDMSSYAKALVEILFIDENIGFAAGQDNEGGVILKTIDGGLTWTKIFNSNISGEYVWKLQVLASNQNYIFGSIETVAPNSGKLVKSSDFGVSWTTKNFPDTDVQAVGFLTETRGWMGGHITGFYETIDGGDTWINNEVGSNLNRIIFINDELGYASGTTIYKFTNQNLKTNDFEEQNRIPLKAYINPNPVNDKLNMTIEFTENDHIRIELYDNLGRLIKELQKDDIKSASQKTYSFDFPYSKGVYIINLHNNTGRQSIKFIK
jgi:photosystem II stability/assembly factor-like uncharacterized protein